MQEVMKKSSLPTPGFGRVLIELDGRAFKDATTAAGGGGRSMATDYGKWSHAVTEVATLRAIGPTLPMGVPALSRPKRFNLMSAGENRRWNDWEEATKHNTFYHGASRFARIGRKVLFSYTAYMDWWELMGLGTNAATAVGDVEFLCAKADQMIAWQDDDGTWKPFYGMGHCFASLHTEQQGFALDEKNGLYLLYRSLALPLIDPKQAEGYLHDKHIVRIEERQIGATVKI